MVMLLRTLEVKALRLENLSCFSFLLELAAFNYFRRAGVVDSKLWHNTPSVMRIYLKCATV